VRIKAAFLPVISLLLAIGGTSSTADNIGPQLSQLANDTDSMKDRIDALAKSNIDAQKVIQDLKGTNDRLYMIGTGAIGAGTAGIIIAAVALSRRNVVEV